MKNYNKPFILDDTFTVSEGIKNMSKEERRKEIEKLEEAAREEQQKSDDNRDRASATA